MQLVAHVSPQRSVIHHKVVTVIILPFMKFPESVTIISDEISQELDVVAAFVREMGFPGIELRSAFGRAFKDLTPSDISQIQARAQSENWKVFGCSTPVFKCPLSDRTAIAQHREECKRALDVANTLQSKLLRVFTFLRDSARDDSSWPQRVVKELLKLGELAAGSGIRIGVENESSCLMATADETLAVMQSLPASLFGVIWDPCNVIYVPEARLPETNDVTRLFSRLFHVHVKDAVRRGQSGFAMPVGVGEAGWRGELAELRRLGYQGMLSLETHWRLEAIKESELHLPAGYSFSRGGEIASRVCARNLQSLLALEAAATASH